MLCTQRCYGRHNVSHKSITTSGLSILLHGVILLPDATSLMRNVRFGPLTLLMTLRVIDVKSDDKFTRLFYVSIHDA